MDEARDRAERVQRNRERLANRIGWTAVYACVAIEEAYPGWSVWYERDRPDRCAYRAEATRNARRCRAWAPTPDLLLAELALAEDRFELPDWEVWPGGTLPPPWQLFSPAV